LGEYNFYSSYLDSNTVAPLLSSYFSQDSDEPQHLREEEEEQRQLDSRRQSKRMSGRDQVSHAPTPGGGGSNRSSARLTPDLFPSLHYR
jgi:hypothetical protein